MTIRLAGAALLLAACSLSAGESFDWPNFRGPAHNGQSKEAGWSTKWPADGPKQLWKANVGTGFASFAVANGKVYTLGNDKKDTDTVYCFDAEKGTEIWKKSYPCKLDPKYYAGGPSATPAVDGKFVYSMSKDGEVLCFDAEKGDIVWDKKFAEDLGAVRPDWGFGGSPLIDGDLLVLNIGSFGLAVEKATGKVKWYSGKEKAGYATPVPYDANGKHAAIIFTAPGAVGVDLADGKELWRFAWPTQYGVNAADPILSGDKVFVASGYDTGSGLFKIEGAKATEVWKSKVMRTHMSGGVLIGEYVYGFDDTILKCVTLADGTEKWKADGFGKGSLIAADGKLLVLGDKGILAVVAADPAGYKEIAKAQVLGGLCWATPVLANGRVYCRNSDGNVVCLDVSGK